MNISRNHHLTQLFKHSCFILCLYEFGCFSKNSSLFLWLDWYIYENSFLQLLENFFLQFLINLERSVSLWPPNRFLFLLPVMETRGKIFDMIKYSLLWYLAFYFASVKVRKILFWLFRLGRAQNWQASSLSYVYWLDKSENCS